MTQFQIRLTFWLDGLVFGLTSMAFFMKGHSIIGAAILLGGSSMAFYMAHKLRSFVI